MTSLKPAVLEMAGQLIGQMTSAWKPREFNDDFTAASGELVRKKAEAGEKAAVKPLEEAPDIAASNMADLSEFLRQSLKRQGGSGPAADAPSKSPSKPAGRTHGGTAGGRAAAKKSAGRPAVSKKAT